MDKASCYFQYYKCDFFAVSSYKTRVFCILDAPSKDAVEKSHQKIGIKCEWIMEVKETAAGRVK
jgi:uncharacterized protein DUF4242